MERWERKKESKKGKHTGEMLTFTKTRTAMRLTGEKDMSFNRTYEFICEYGVLFLPPYGIA